MTTSNSIDRACAVARSAAARVRAWFDPPLAADARPLEIRTAILERLELLTEPSSPGRRVLPGNRLLVTLLATDPQAGYLLQAALADVEDSARTRLTELRCPVPHGFAIDVAVVKEPRADWGADQRFSVDLQNAPGGRSSPTPPTTAIEQVPVTIGARASASRVPVMRIAIQRGATTEPEYVFAEPRVLIGRTAAPVDRAGRPRHNHVVFLDEGSEHNATVGRAHASIRFEADRQQFRLFDEGSHNGTRIVRHGDTIDVTPHNPVGVALLSGDEVQFGTTSVIVTFE
jgi:hypothetical protein